MSEARIVRLSSDVIDRIAAGEVVERPASVVKELLENALDAGARSVEVSLDAGGLERVVVCDDGAGMHPADARLAMQRHATSKLRDAQDLFNIETLGFRGEALSSIASVSRMSVTTRRQGQDAAFRIEVEGGKLIGECEVGAPVGTTIVVDDLFYNTPARKKFMRAPATEQSHAVQAAMRVLLGTPRAGLVLESSGRRLLDIPPDAEPAERVRAALGRRVERVWPFARITDGVEVSGFIASPDGDRRDTKGIWLFVNGRFVRDRTLQRAVMEAYSRLLERGRYPVVVLHVCIDPSVVDVNVHPQKLEVRFSDGRVIYRAVRAALTEVLGEAPWLCSSDALSSPRQQLAPIRYQVGSNLEGSGAPQARLWAASPASPASPGYSAPQAGPALGPWGTGRFSRLEVAVQSGRYIIGRSMADGSLTVIDRVRAQRAVARESLEAQLAVGRVASETLLLPEVVELSSQQQQLLTTRAREVAGAGFEIDEVGPQRFAVRAVPAALVLVPAHQLALAMLRALADSSQRWVDVCLEQLAAGPLAPLDGAQLGALFAAVDRLDAASSRGISQPLDAQRLERLFDE